MSEQTVLTQKSADHSSSGRHPSFLHQAFQVILHRVLADAQLVRNFFVREAFQEVPRDRVLSWCQVDRRCWGRVRGERARGRLSRLNQEEELSDTFMN